MGDCLKSLYKEKTSPASKKIVEFEHILNAFRF